MSKPADDFTARKLAWIEQVITDVSLPLLARAIGTAIATIYLNRETEEAWPSVPTLSAVVGRGWTQVHAALVALESAGHLSISWTAGGKGQTHRYRLIHKVKPHGNPKGLKEGGSNPNPTEIRRQTPRKSDAKPHGNPGRNPLSEPIDEPIEAPGGGLPTARRPPSRSTINGPSSTSSALKNGNTTPLAKGSRRVPITRAEKEKRRQPRPCWVGMETEIPKLGLCVIDEIYPKERRVRVKVKQSGKLMTIGAADPDIVFVSPPVVDDDDFEGDAA